MERIIYRKTLDVHKNGVQFILQGFETADNMSRVIEISLMASGDAIDLPLENIMAVMYVTSPGATEPSINDCRVEDNKVIYDVLPIVTEGITTMQLKLIETSVGGAESVLMSPKFAVGVSRSEADEEDAEQSTTFTALENAVALAKEMYDGRLLRIEIDETCTFRAYYADGMVYETDEIRKTLLQASTELDLDSLIKDSITKFTADEVAVVLDEKYKKLFSNARYVSNLLTDFAEATFVQWDDETKNTPYKAGLTECSKGFAHVFGTVEGNHVIIAWTMSGENLNYFTHYIVDGTDKGWDSLLSKLDDYLQKSGGKMTGPLELGDGKGTISADDDSTYLESVIDSENYRKLIVRKPSIDSTAFLRAITFLSTVDGEEKEYNLFGDHNSDELCIAKIKTGSYVGNGSNGGDYFSPDYSGNVLIPCEKCPKMIVIRSSMSVAFAIFTGDAIETYFTVLLDHENSSVHVASFTFNAEYDGTGIVWSTTDSDAHYNMNYGGTTFSYMLLY